VGNLVGDDGIEPPTSCV